MANKLEKFGETNYSQDKAFLNAIVVSDVSYVPKKKKENFKLKVTMWTYAFIVLTITTISLGMLSFSADYQSDHKTLFSFIEVVVFIVLTIDLILRWYTSEVRIRKGNWSYFLFPATITGVILIVSLLPSLYLINVWTGEDFIVFRTFEGMKFLRIFRIILLANMVPGIAIFRKVLIKEKRTLLVVFSIVLITIVLFALVIYSVETSNEALKIYTKNNKNTLNQGPFTRDDLPIKNFLDALYFSTVALTTIGFGDISPMTDIGKVVVMVMSIIGIAILATPAGVITGGFIQEIKDSRKQKDSKSK